MEGVVVSSCTICARKRLFAVVWSGRTGRMVSSFAQQIVFIPSTSFQRLPQLPLKPPLAPPATSLAHSVHPKAMVLVARRAFAPLTPLERPDECLTLQFFMHSIGPRRMVALLTHPNFSRAFLPAVHRKRLSMNDAVLDRLLYRLLRSPSVIVLMT